jgi:hypothetical protein
MTHSVTKDLRSFDVCNGDADGLTAVLQWRLHDPAPATLVTGLKREIALLEQVPDGADEVLVCDLSIARNREALQRLLNAGAHVRYFDHHFAAEVPVHDKLEAHLDANPELCTSLLMDRWLGGRFHTWALVGAYGDALTGVAHRRAAAAGYTEAQRAALRRLGEAINYNAYGDDENDVRMAPAKLYRLMARHADPFEMIADEESLVDELHARRSTDLRQALALRPVLHTEHARLVVLPDAPWSRRVIGCLANELAAADPRQAQAVLKHRPGGGFVVSVRAPRAAPVGAADFCAAFGGGGREAAAGVDVLPARDYERFVAAFGSATWCVGRAGSC